MKVTDEEAENVTSLKACGSQQRMRIAGAFIHHGPTFYVVWSIEKEMVWVLWPALFPVSGKQRTLSVCIYI